jgi:hypothetical protein
VPVAARPRARVSVTVSVRSIVAVVLLTVSVGAFALTPRGGVAAAVADAPLRIRMFGDSVMLGAHDDLLAAFPGTDTNVDAIESRSLLGTTPVLVAHPDLLGDVVVLDLGYNDMPDGAVFRERVDAMMQALANVPRVVWLTQSVFQPTRVAMNDELRAAADRYPNLDVVDWDAQVAAHPEYVYADGIHLTPPGRAAFAAGVQQRIDAYRMSRTRARDAVPTATAVSVAGATSGATAGAAVESTAESGAASPTAAPAARTFAAAAIGGVALVVLAGVVLLRRAPSAAPVMTATVIAGGSGPSRRRGCTPATRRSRGRGTGAPGLPRSP